MRKKKYSKDQQLMLFDWDASEGSNPEVVAQEREAATAIKESVSCRQCCMADETGERRPKESEEAKYIIRIYIGIHSGRI